MSPQVIKILLYVYGFLMLVGGVMGYVKAGSKASLIMGLISGGIILLGLYIANNNPSLGFSIVTITSALLCVVFVIRLVKTKAFMPSGMLLILSVIALIVCLINQMSNR